ncbi:MAG: carbon-nitrogen hydrolase [Cyclobacteriaceae bacterium]|nr:carbon-nitrogen hydrolase [Cyclobacteriaceae bacterium]UYN85365.1 MAG: carbon-nitrogen hydrolase [Cyclobacteriaceae bacterium]
MKRIILVLVIIAVLYSTWTFIGRDELPLKPDSYLDQIEVISADDSLCHRNIVGIQPYMLPTDYQSKDHFYGKLRTYFDEASKAGYFKTNTVVLLPEYLGTWLVVSHEKQSVIEASSINFAMTLMVLSNPIQFIQAYRKGQNEKDAFAAALFRMKAQAMAHIYAEVFTKLSSEYAVTINAGSIVLPGPTIRNTNQINVVLSKPLYNASFIFYPDGKIDQIVTRKSFPISSEQPFVSAYPVNELQAYDLSVGKTAVLVCADSWYPESYAQISELKADVVLVNSYCSGENTMAMEWKGYDGGNEPGDVIDDDIGKLTEQEAWIKYALPGRLKSCGATIGVNVFLRGELWDLGSDGQPFFIKDGQLLPVQKSDQAGIWNLCF